MSENLRDPFLRAGAVIVRSGQHLFAFGVMLTLLAVPFSIIFAENVLPAAHQHFGIAESQYPVGPVVLLLLFVAAVLALWWMFFRYLSKLWLR